MVVIGCAAKTIKYFVIFGSVLTLLAGLAIVVTGICMLAVPEFKRLIDIDNGLLYKAAALTTALGVFVSLLGALAFFGAIREIQWLMGTFIGLMFILFVLQITLGSYVLAKRIYLENTVKEVLEIAARKVDTDPASCSLWRKTETTFHCCGLNGKQIEHNNETCNLPLWACDGEHEASCHAKVVKNTYEVGISIGIVLVFFGIVELLPIAFAICLCFSIREGRKQQIGSVTMDVINAFPADDPVPERSRCGLEQPKLITHPLPLDAFANTNPLRIG